MQTTIAADRPMPAFRTPHSADIASTPAPIQLTQRLAAFCRGVGPERPIVVQCCPTFTNRTECSSAAVARKVLGDGGAPLLGWAVRAVADLWAEAEYRTVWVSPAGQVYDMACNAQRHGSVLFIPDSGRSASVDFRRRPPTLHERLIIGAREVSLADVVAAGIAPLERSVLEASVRSKGLTLAQAVRAALNTGCPLAESIDDYLEEAGALGAMTVPTSTGVTVRESHRKAEFEIRQASAERARRAILRRFRQDIGEAEISDALQSKLSGECQ